MTSDNSDKNENSIVNQDSETGHSNFITTKKFSFQQLDWVWVLFGLLLLSVLFIRLHFLSIPFQRDEGTYAYFGQLLLDGKIPYLDFYEMKLPGIFYCYALIISLFGASVEGIHAGFTIINLISIYFMFRVGCLWFNKPIGLVIATAFAFLSLNPFVSGFTTESEHLIVFFLSAALLVMLKGLQKENMWYYFFSGMLFCATMLVKQNGVFFVLYGGLVITSYYLINKEINPGKALKSGVIYSAGVLIPLIIVLSIVAVQGAMSEFIFWIYKYPKSYVDSISWNPEGKQLLMMYWDSISHNYYLFFILAFLGLIATGFCQLNLHKKVMIWVFAILSFIAIVPGLRFYGHYWIYLMPAVAVLIGVTIQTSKESLAKYFKGNLPTYVAFGIFAVVLLVHLVQVQTDSAIKYYYTNPDATNVLRKVYGFNPFPDAKIVGDWIRQHSIKTDKIAVFGSEPQVFIYANRRGISKHNYLGYLVKNTPHAAQWQHEYIADVKAAMPKFLVFFRNRISWSPSLKADLSIFRFFDSFSAKYYDLVGMTQVLGENKIGVKWGKTAAGQMFHQYRSQEIALMRDLREAIKHKNQQAIVKFKKQQWIYRQEIIVYQRKSDIKASQQQ